MDLSKELDIDLDKGTTQSAICQLNTLDFEKECLEAIEMQKIQGWKFLKDQKHKIEN